MSTFHPFPRLPYELRTQIWSLATPPRIVHVRQTELPGGHEIACVVSPTPSHPVLQVCRESRQLAAYQRAFTDGAEPRYTWIDFEADMICIQSVDLLHELRSHRLDIQRLRLTSDGSQDSYDNFFYWGGKELREFPKLKEIHVIIDVDMSIWSTIFEGSSWGSCPMENIRFIDSTSGLMLNGYQLSMLADWTMFFSWEGVGNVQDIDNLSEEIEWAIDDSHLSMSQIEEIE